MLKKALVVTRNFPPLVGGMERLLEHVLQEMQKGYECSLVGPLGCAEHFEASGRVGECSVTPVTSFLFCALVKATAFSARNNFRFCLAGSGVTAPIAAFIKTWHGVPAVSFVHGLDLIAENFFYQSFFIPALKKMDIVIANSRNTKLLAIAKGIDAEKIEILCPGVEMPEAPNRGVDEFLARHDLVGKKILLSVGRMVPRKGLAEFLRYSFPGIVGECPGTVLVIIGTEPEKSINKNVGIQQELTKIVRDTGLSGHVRLLGNVDDRTLASAYQAADVFIFPLREIAGDVEGFGMVATEAASYGVPTIVFAVGGVTDAVQHNYSGLLVESGDYRAFTELTCRLLENDVGGVTPDNCREFASRFSWGNFGVRLSEIFLRVVKEGNHHTGSS